MSTDTLAAPLPAPGARTSPSLPRTIVGAVWDPATWIAAFHLMLNMPIGIIWFTLLVTGLATGIGTIVTLVGIPVLMLTAMLVRGGGQVERGRLRVFLACPLPDPYRPLPEGSWLTRALARAGDPALWRDLVYLLLRMPIGIATFTLVFSLGVTGFAAMLSPLFAWALPGSVQFPGLVPGSAASLVATCVSGVLITIAWAWCVRGLASLERILAGALLGTSPAALQVRVGELARSRARSVDASADERRRIERDLHDGAQQRMIAVGMTLGLALQKMGTDPAMAESLVREAHEESKRAIQDLRELARGIHPALLSERGLPAALRALASRSTVPVELAVDLPARPPAAVESAAYFVVAESLVNAAKHSGATRIDVSVTRKGERLVVEVRDDGQGGARVAPGGGLAGLADRVAALDGTLAVDSPPRGPTIVHAEIPCGS